MKHHNQICLTIARYKPSSPLTKELHGKACYICTNFRVEGRYCMSPVKINFRPDAHTANTYLQLLLVDWADYFEGQALNTYLLRRQAKLEQNPFWSIFFCTWEWWYNFCPSDNFKLFPVLKLSAFFIRPLTPTSPLGKREIITKTKLLSQAQK